MRERGAGVATGRTLPLEPLPHLPHPVTDPERLRGLAARGRRHVLEMVARAGAGHIGGPLSAMDILVALYFGVLRVDPGRPDWAARDRFILSKGHSATALYAVLAMRGYFPEAWLASFDSLASPLQGHPDMTRCPGVEMSTGSLGQGLSAGLGMALGAVRLGLNLRVFVLLGDGECQEGQVWECAHTAASFGATGLRAIVDWNGLPQYAWPNTAPLAVCRTHIAARFRAFGWEVAEVDGHDPAALCDVLGREPSLGRPLAIIARTHKGEGVSFMRDEASWHARVPTPEELAAAIDELRITSDRAGGAPGMEPVRGLAPAPDVPIGSARDGGGWA